MTSIFPCNSMVNDTFDMLRNNTTDQRKVEFPDWEWPNSDLRHSQECVRFVLEIDRKYYIQISKRMARTTAAGAIPKFTVTVFEPDQPNIGRTLELDERSYLQAEELCSVLYIDPRGADALCGIFNSLGVNTITSNGDIITLQKDDTMESVGGLS